MFTCFAHRKHVYFASAVMEILFFALYFFDDLGNEKREDKEPY
jgi:hypothetical protein